MQKAIAFTLPIAVKGLRIPAPSAEMMYLLTKDVEQHGKNAILRQLSRLFEVDLEELLHPALDETPVINMKYDPFEEEWQYEGDRENKEELQFSFQLAKTVQTGENDDELGDLMQQEGWSVTAAIHEEIAKLLQMITTYPYFWRAIKYQDQDWLKPYFESPKPSAQGEEKVITDFFLDVQELTYFFKQVKEHRLLWFAKYYQ